MDAPFSTDYFSDPPDLPLKSNVLTIYNLLTSGCFLSTKRLDLDKCCVALGNSYYNPAEFPALRIDVKGKSDSIYTVSIFESGKVQSTGGCRPIEAKKAIMKIARKLNKKLNYNLKFVNFEIQNILAVFDFGFPIPLNNFSSMYKGFVDYEPDRFPAVRVRLIVPDNNVKISREASEELNANDSKISENKPLQEEVSTKIRKLMMGDLINRNDKTEWSSHGGVGSYIISGNSKRLLTSRKNPGEKKEEWVNANIFSTGKVTFAGAKSVNSLNYVVDLLRPYLENVIRIQTNSEILPLPLQNTNITLNDNDTTTKDANLLAKLNAKIVELQKKENLTKPYYS